MKEINDLISDTGILTTESVMKEGISKFRFYKYIKENHFEQVGHGIYISSDTICDQLFILYKRCPHCVFSHDEAMYYHGLIDREPLQQTITIYTGYNTKRLTQDGVKVYTVKKELLEIGKITVTDNLGNEIPMYDLERTMCDVIRSRSNIEIQDFNMALKSYVRRYDKDLNKLMKYAKLFNIEKIMRKYMEVLL